MPSPIKPSLSRYLEYSKALENDKKKILEPGLTLYKIIEIKKNIRYLDRIVNRWGRKYGDN